jgi:small subunit ribosomal protein S2
MIIRSIARAAAGAPLSAARVLPRSAFAPLRRSFASEVDAIAASADNSFKQLHSLEAQINAQSPEQVLSIDPEAATAEPGAPSIAEQYHLYKQQREQPAAPSQPGRPSDTT